MFYKPKKSVYGEFAMAVTLVSVLCVCSPSTSIRPDNIRSSEDSIILGRIRFLFGPTCTRSVQLPTFELRNATENTSTSFKSALWVDPQESPNIDIAIVRKVTPGTYDIRIEVPLGRWDSVWLDENLLTLVRFEVLKGFLVYFGTIEVDLSCQDIKKQMAAQYAQHRLRDESDTEMGLFREQYPEIYQMYQGKIHSQMPRGPWEEL